MRTHTGRRRLPYDWYLIVHRPTQSTVGVIVVDGAACAGLSRGEQFPRVPKDEYLRYADLIGKAMSSGKFPDHLDRLRTMIPGWGVYLGGTWPRTRNMNEVVEVLYESVVGASLIPVSEKELEESLTASDEGVVRRLTTREIPVIPERHTNEIPVWPFPDWGKPR